MLRRFIATTLLCSLTLTAVACHQYVTIRQPLEFIANQKPPEVLVTRSDGTQYSVSGPQVFGDTVVGYVNGKYEEIKFNNVGSVRVRENARGKTVLLIGASVVGAVGIAFLVSGVGATQTGSVVTDCDDDPTQPGC